MSMRRLAGYCTVALLLSVESTPGLRAAGSDVADAVMRKLPGALGHEESALEESFSEALEGAPEYPHYTRPFEWRGHAVPDVLLSGDHGRIREGRLEQSRARRPKSP